MSEEKPRFSLGIDLGTTHCALSFLSPKSKIPDSFPIPQVIAPGEVSSRSLLPSFLYHAAEGEFPGHALSLPWSAEPASSESQEVRNQVVGQFARKKGATTPARLISSAKSWLSHAGVDREAKILPWGAPEGIVKISPLHASACYLSHLRQAWEAAHPEQAIAMQDVVLTVPASFDVVARELTLKAATLAGFTRSPRLLEEPQAALYDWVAQSEGKWREEVKIGDQILVVDVGGGTTDFSLIAVCEREGSLELERIAVGDHILLGGDNMDLALAHTVRARLEAGGKKIDDWQMQALTHGCREAKEKLLSADPPLSVPLVIPARGSKLIGGSLRTELTLDELNAVLLEGFFPLVPATAQPQVPRRVGLVTVGLPYASDAGITRHLAAFLRRAAFGTEHKSVDVDQKSLSPTKILFNGGVTRSPIIRDRLLDLMKEWAAPNGAPPPSALRGTDAELAVSRGAAYYCQACSEGGLRIRSGTAQSHYIGIERAELAIPGVPPRVDAVCVAPFGMEEGTEHSLDQVFGLVLGEPVSFRFLASSERRSDEVGAVVSLGDVNELAPLETTLDGAAGEIVHVRLHAKVTETGSLEIAAVEEGDKRRWKLDFNIRTQ